MGALGDTQYTSAWDGLYEIAGKHSSSLGSLVAKTSVCLVVNFRFGTNVNYSVSNEESFRMHNTRSHTAVLAHLFPLTKLFKPEQHKGCLHHRPIEKPVVETEPICSCPSCRLYLGVAVESSVVQGSSATTVRHVHAAQHGDDDFSTLQRVVCCGNVQRCLPVLVSCIHIC